MADVVVAVAREHRTHPRGVVDALGERPCDRERHVLLARSAAADRAGILAAVSRVDRDDDVAVRVARRVNCANGLRFLPRRCSSARGRLRGRRVVARETCRIAELDDEPAAATGAVLPARARLDGSFYVEHDSQGPAGLRAGTDLTDDALPLRHAHALGELGVPEIDDDASRLVEREEFMRRAAREIEDEACPAPRARKLEAADLGGARGGPCAAPAARQQRENP